MTVELPTGESWSGDQHILRQILAQGRGVKSADADDWLKSAKEMLVVMRERLRVEKWEEWH